MNKRINWMNDEFDINNLTIRWIDIPVVVQTVLLSNRTWHRSYSPHLVS